MVKCCDRHDEPKNTISATQSKPFSKQTYTTMPSFPLNYNSNLATINFEAPPADDTRRKRRSFTKTPEKRCTTAIRVMVWIAAFRTTVAFLFLESMELHLVWRTGRRWYLKVQIRRATLERKGDDDDPAVASYPIINQFLLLAKIELLGISCMSVSAF